MVKFKGKNGSAGTADVSAQHVPVMLQEVLCALSPRADAVYVDGTFGLGGYTRALLEGAACRVIAFDQDPAAVPIAAQFKEEFGERFEFVAAPFETLKKNLEALGVPQVDGVVLDLGVSSPQLDVPERGFSFRLEGPLDMRMRQEGLTAADVVNEEEADALADLFWRYGDERKSRIIARKIVQRRAEKPFETTVDLAEVVASVFPVRGPQKIHPATRVFQALRIFVNRELDQLKAVLDQSTQVLKELGRLVVVSFHSLEDRMVKDFFHLNQEVLPQGSRYMPEAQTAPRPFYFELSKKGALKPTAEEVLRNPRSRSARLRWGILHT